MLFDPAGGVIYCGEHAPGAGLTPLIPLSPGVFQAMRHIIYSDFGKLFRFRLAEESQKQLAAASEAYLLAQVERVLPALNFYKTVCLGPQAEQ